MTSISLFNPRDALLNQLGIGPVWRLRTADSLQAAREEAQVPTVMMPVAQMDWAQLQTAVSVCQKCSLCATRTQTVFGSGDVRPQYLLIGDFPDAQADLDGTPFAGRVEQLMDSILATIGTTREQGSFSANLVKCHPVGSDGKDRPPSAEEIAACQPFLERQITLLQPQVILALGTSAATTLLAHAVETASTPALAAYRYQDTPLVATRHPADLLRDPAQKSTLWADLCLAMDVLQREV